MSRFLTRPEIRELTAFAIKAKQIEQLRKMGIPFFVNGGGWPVVAFSAIEGRTQEPQPQSRWTPAVLQRDR